MKKALKCLICLFLVLVTLQGSVTAFAVEPKASTRIKFKFAYIETTGNGYFNVYYNVRAYYEMQKLGALKVTIYKSDGTWYHTFYNDSTPDMMGSDVSYYSHSISFRGVPGRSYYAEVTFYAQDSDGNELIPYNTEVVTV